MGKEQSHKSQNIVWQDGKIKQADRESRDGHKGVIIWLTGLSGSGKTTIGIQLEHQLFLRGKNCYRLDGDNVRFGLNSDLGFSPEERDENIRRVGEVAKLFADAGMIVITSFISPYCHERDRVRDSVPRPKDFIEVYLNCPLEVCEERDVKGLYAKARAGTIKEFTGISAPYEAPEKPEIILNTAELSVQDCVVQLLEYLDHRHYFEADATPTETTS